MLLSAVHNYLALAMTLVAFSYVYVTVFTNFGRMAQVYTYTQLCYRIFSCILFAVIVFSLLFSIPLFSEASQTLSTLIGAVANL